jgi:hypothetical protein
MSKEQFTPYSTDLNMTRVIILLALMCHIIRIY